MSIKIGQVANEEQSHLFLLLLLNSVKLDRLTHSLGPNVGETWPSRRFLLGTKASSMIPIEKNKYKVESLGFDDSGNGDVHNGKHYAIDI